MARSEKRPDPFVQWLTDNREAVLAGEARYQGFPVTLETVVTQYLVAVSCGFLTVKHPTRIYVVGHDAAAGHALFYTFVSATLGWWSIPWGPVCTLEAIAANLRGGSKQTVGEMIDALTGHRRDVVTLTQAAAELARQQMAESGFPDGTAIRVEASRDFHPQYRIVYDEPVADDRDWRGTSQGLTILVDKDLAAIVDGLEVDCEAGRFVFRK